MNVKRRENMNEEFQVGTFFSLLFGTYWSERWDQQFNNSVKRQ